MSQEEFSDEHESSENEIEEYTTEPDIDELEDEEDLIEIYDNIPKFQFGEVHVDEGLTCICKSFTDIYSSIASMESLLNITPNFDNHFCIIDNIIRSFNYIFSNINKKLHYSKVAFADLFYRIRHETLFKVFCMAVNLPAEHSDVPFSNFGIESNRTPDLIIQDQDTLFVIEITATSSLEKAAISKGMEEMGFESKYKKEIDLLASLGKQVIYLPMFFDMSNTSMPINADLFKTVCNYFKVSSPYYALLQAISKEFAILTMNLKNTLILPSAVLFSKPLPIKVAHKSFEFLYDKVLKIPMMPRYKELTISMPVYNKINNDKQRLFRLLDNNSYTDSDKLIYVLSNIGHRITLEQNNIYGTTINNLRETLMCGDTAALMKYVKLRMGNVIIDTTNSETGVKFLERQNITDRGVSMKNSDLTHQIPTLQNHNTINYKCAYSFSKYKALVSSFISQNMVSKHFDKDYEDQIVQLITDMDLDDIYSKTENSDCPQVFKNMLGSLTASSIDIDLVMNDLKLDYYNKNVEVDKMPMVKLKMKSPFLLPIADINCDSYCPLELKNIDFISFVAEFMQSNNPFTSLVLNNVLSESYKMFTKSKPASSTLLNLYSKRSSISNEINYLQKRLYKDKKANLSNESLQISKTNINEYKSKFDSLKKEYNILNKSIKEKKISEKVGEDISFIRLPTKNQKSNLRILYNREMEHFKDKKKQSTIEGVGIRKSIEDDFNSDIETFNSISEMLCEDRGTNPDKILDEYVANDVKLLFDLKNAALNDTKALLDQILNSALGHSTAFVSRIAHSLMFYSQLSFNSDYVRVDNLGYKNCLLIVRGGKKIFKSKSSKLFRLIYPISEVLLPWYINGHRNKGSSQFFRYNDTNYCVTPWTMLHESILTDSISFHSRVCSFVLLNLNKRVELKRQFHKLSINVILAFHNRRKTEVILANLRYILLSTLGDFTGITAILKEFFDFNYDCFQSFIRNCILFNYPIYFNQLKILKEERGLNDKTINLSDFVNTQLKNIFTGSVIHKVEDLTLMIYSTFLMTKAPYQKLAERANNLKGILEIHQVYDRDVGLRLRPEEQLNRLNVSIESGCGYKKYVEELFSNDFKIDSKFNACVGNFIDSYYTNLNCQDDLETAWLNIMNESWDEMATSTGLRGDYDLVEDFWGQKGYFVVYKHLLTEPDYVTKMLKLFSTDLESDSKRKLLRSLNEVYVDKLNPEREFLIFHAVDKVQWRGSREIYVMDMMTKTMQQPIEKFMGVLCKKLDNELISIPSDRRSQVIHHSIFERDLPLKEMLTWYLTLDCSKWAPKSVFVKFAIMILNMFSIPNSFKVHFLNYLEKLYKKRIYFNRSEVEVLINNQTYTEVCKKYLIEDKKVNGYYLEMPYSWVMGIFNYTSSFMHAANQKYASYLLMKTSLKNYKEETSLVMFAHSDDSGGRLNVSSMYMAKRAVIIYEILLKTCNHLLSKKKSVISKIYFEILSIIYMFKRLLALLPKFLGGLRFLPTDKGPSQDMLQSYSKGIEVLIAGADFSTSYIVMKIYSYLVWRFYYTRPPNKYDYERPVQYLGLPDAHPLMSLLIGTDSDILRIIKSGCDITNLMSFVNTISSSMEEEGPIKNIKFEIKVKGVKKGFEDFIDLFKDELNSWSLRNVNYHNSPMNALNFLRKLNDSGFVGSLVNESITRRISRSYFIRSGDSAITSIGNVKLSAMLDSIVLFQSYSRKEPAIEHIMKELLNEKQLERLEADYNRNKDYSLRSLKMLTNTLKSAIKIMKYMDMIDLSSRKITNINRTLKPTHVQLVKSSRIFSTNFDPASLVSYLKEPQYRWALQSVKNLNISAIEAEKFCRNMGFDIDTIEPDLLLRICRTYGRDNTKNIYLYSRVPGEIRQLKTYSSYLTFLSVNSFENKEIGGLTLKLSDKDLGKEYTQSNLIEEVYIVNNIVSLMLTLLDKLDLEFLLNLNIKSVDEIEWEGGSVLELIKHIESLSQTDVRYNIILPQVIYLKFKMGSRSIDLNDLNKMAYYTFLKSQRSRGGWVGKGEVYIRVENNFYSFVLENSTINSMYSNKVGKLPQHHSDFILDVLDNIGVRIDNVKPVKYSDFNNNMFGFDNTGDLAIYKGREIEKGVNCISLVNRNEFVDNLSNFEMSSLNSDILIIKSGFEGNFFFKKLHLLPIKKAELVNTIRMILDPKDFEEKLLTTGVNEFEEFIYTEILTEYGKEIYIDFNSLFDNFLGSRLYEVMKKVNDNDISKICKTFNFSPLPASEGSLIRILIDYSRQTNDVVVKVPVNLTPTMMQLRSEYPEQTITLLGDKMQEYHKQIYSRCEIKEISDSYECVSESNDITKVRTSLIKLMTYWGYGSLVHSIQNFTLIRDQKNYIYFNLNMADKNGSQFSNIFVNLLNSLLKTVLNWEPYFSSLEPLSQILFKNADNSQICKNYVYFIANSVYNFKTIALRPSLYQIQFDNLLLALLKEEDFCAELQQSFQEDYILGSIPISYKYRFELISIINVLCHSWCVSNLVELNNEELNYRVKNQRLSDGIPNYKNIASRIIKNNLINFSPAEVYYHGFINDNFLSYIFSLGEINCGDCIYRLSNKVSNISKTEVIANEVLKFKRPLSPECLESPEMEDLAYELTMNEIDEDEVNMMKEDIGDMYKPKITKKMKVRGNFIIRGTIHWVIDPNRSHLSSNINFYRQVGENVIIVSDNYLNLNKYFPNSGCRLVNLNKRLKMNCKPFFFNYILSKELFNNDFLNNFLGGVEYDYYSLDYSLIKHDLIRDINGEIIESKNQGFQLNEKLLSSKKVVSNDDGVLILVSEDADSAIVEESGKDNEKNPEINEKEAKLIIINKEIDKISNSRMIDEDSIKHLRQKYLIKAVEDGLTQNMIINSLVRESDLISINNEALSNASGISSKNQLKMFLSPEYFSLNHGVSRTEIKPIKDKKLRSEINSLYPNLADKIGSNTLKISHKYKKFIMANFKMWNRMVNFGSYKKENKKFLLSIFISICNTAVVGEEEDDDHKWQDIMNQMTVYISDDGPESEESEDEISGLLFSMVPASRLRYRPEGM